jgi:hypothetical protein
MRPQVVPDEPGSGPERDPDEASRILILLVRGATLRRRLEAYGALISLDVAIF